MPPSPPTPKTGALACSTICFRAQPLAEALEEVVIQGFDAVDLGALQGLCEHVPPFAGTEELDEVARVVAASGLRVLAVNADPGSFNEGISPIEVLDRVETLASFCSSVSSPLLILPCWGPELAGEDPELQIEALAAGLNAAAESAGRYGVALAVEAPHHYRLVNTLERTRSLLRRLGPEVGLVYDVSHVRAAGEDPAGSFAEFSDRVAHVHLRDAETGDIRKVLGAGDIDFAAVRRSAESAGYAGRYVLELETHDSPFATKAEEVAHARRRLGPIFQSPVEAAR